MKNTIVSESSSGIAFVTAKQSSERPSCGELQHFTLCQTKRKSIANQVLRSFNRGLKVYAALKGLLQGILSRDQLKNA